MLQAPHAPLGLMLQAPHTPLGLMLQAPHGSLGLMLQALGFLLAAAAAVDGHPLGAGLDGQGLAHYDPEHQRAAGVQSPLAEAPRLASETCLMVSERSVGYVQQLAGLDAVQWEIQSC